MCVCLMPSAMILAFVRDMYMVYMSMCSVCASFGMLWKHAAQAATIHATYKPPARARRLHMS